MTGAEFETIDYHDVFSEIVKLEGSMQQLIDNLDMMSVADVVKQALRIHHRITVIHPFGDGNGRCSRALLNWIFRRKGLPPVYIKYPEKDEYYGGLKNADTGKGFEKLYRVIMKELIRRSMQLNKVSD